MKQGTWRMLQALEDRPDDAYGHNITCRATLAVRPDSVSTTASAEAAGTLKHPCAEVSTYSAAYLPAVKQGSWQQA